MKRDRRPLDKRQFCYTKRECAAIAGVTPDTWESYHKAFTDQPTTPCSKNAVIAFMQRHELPRPYFHYKPKYTAEVLRLRDGEGWTFQQIADYFGFTDRGNAYRCWRLGHAALRKRKEKSYAR